ncbi:MAG: type I restriction enzyme HsdR N-terminal domain-containing protein [Bacteroidia bacterium]
MKTSDILNLPAAPLRLEEKNGKTFVFDLIRKKWLQLTPEEWVRQHMINYLINNKSYPASLFSLEAGLTYNGLKKRSDILVYGINRKPLLLVECKSTSVAINQQVVEQVSVYNTALGAAYLCVTNGLKHYCWNKDEATGNFQFFNEIPDYKEVSLS